MKSFKVGAITFPHPSKLYEKSSTLIFLLVYNALNISTPPEPLIEFQRKYNSNNVSLDSINYFKL